MLSFRIPVILIFCSVVLFTTLMITLTHSEFQCDVETSGGEGTCTEYKIDEDKSFVCDGSVFHIVAAENTTDIIILCPWNFWTIFTNAIGVLSGLGFAVLVVLAIVRKKAIAKKLTMRLGFLSTLILAISTIVMGANLSGGYGKCQEFREAIGDKISEVDCSIAAFGWDVALMSIGVLLLAYEAFQEYRKYRFGEGDDLAKADVLTQESDYNVRFFEDN